MANKSKQRGKSDVDNRNSEFNRDKGLIDLVPEVYVGPVVVKLEFIHPLVPTQLPQTTQAMAGSLG